MGVKVNVVVHRCGCKQCFENHNWSKVDILQGLLSKYTQTHTRGPAASLPCPVPSDLSRILDRRVPYIFFGARFCPICGGTKRTQDIAVYLRYCGSCEPSKLKLSKNGGTCRAALNGGEVRGTTVYAAGLRL